MDHLSAALAGSQHCTQPDCMGNEGRDGGMERWRDGGMEGGKECGAKKKKNTEPKKSDPVEGKRSRDSIFNFV